MNPDPNTTTGEPPKALNASALSKLIPAWADAMAMALPIGGAGLIIAVVIGVFNLGLIFNMGWLYSALVSGGCVLLLVGHAGSIVKADTNSKRLLHGLSVIVWLFLFLSFGVLYMAMRSAGVDVGMTDEIITEKLAKSTLSAEVMDVGRTMYSYATAIGMATSVISFVVSFAMSHPLADKVHKTLGESFAPMANNIILGLVVITSAQHVLQYGQHFGGLGMFESLTACVVAELTFIVGEQFALREIKARFKSGSYDRFDLIAWGLLTLFALAYMMLINALYGHMATLTAGGMELAEAHAKTNGGLYGWAKSFYSVSAPVFGGLIVALKLATTYINAKAGGPDKTAPPQPKGGASGNGPRMKMAKDDPTGTGQTNPDPFKDKQGQPGRAPQTTTERTCQHCGATFQGSTVARYCSTACKSKAKRARAGAKGGATP